MIEVNIIFGNLIHCIFPRTGKHSIPPGFLWIKSFSSSMSSKCLQNVSILKYVQISNNSKVFSPDYELDFGGLLGYHFHYPSGVWDIFWSPLLDNNKVKCHTLMKISCNMLSILRFTIDGLTIWKQFKVH